MYPYIGIYIYSYNIYLFILTVISGTPTKAPLTLGNPHVTASAAQFSEMAGCFQKLALAELLVRICDPNYLQLYGCYLMYTE